MQRLFEKRCSLGGVVFKSQTHFLLMVIYTIVLGHRNLHKRFFFNPFNHMLYTHLLYVCYYTFVIRFSTKHSGFFFLTSLNSELNSVWIH